MNCGQNQGGCGGGMGNAQGCPPVVLKTGNAQQNGRNCVFQLPPVNVVCQVPPAQTNRGATQSFNCPIDCDVGQGQGFPGMQNMMGGGQNMMMGGGMPNMMGGGGMPNMMGGGQNMMMGGGMPNMMGGGMQNQGCGMQNPCGMPNAMMAGMQDMCCPPQFNNRQQMGCPPEGGQVTCPSPCPQQQNNCGSGGQTPQTFCIPINFSCPMPPQDGCCGNQGGAGVAGGKRNRREKRFPQCNFLKPIIDTRIYRDCEAMCVSYAGHIPGEQFIHGRNLPTTTTFAKRRLCTYTPYEFVDPDGKCSSCTYP